MIYANFESILVPQVNGKQNNKKHVAFSYGHKLVCVDDKFSKPFKSYLGEYAVYNLINSMIEENEHWIDIKNKNFNKRTYNY